MCLSSVSVCMCGCVRYGYTFHGWTDFNGVTKGYYKDDSDVGIFFHFLLCCCVVFLFVYLLFSLFLHLNLHLNTWQENYSCGFCSEKLFTVLWCMTFLFLILSKGIICALFNVCASVYSPCVCSSADVSEWCNTGVVRWSDWYGAEVTGKTLSRADGKGCFCTGSGRIKCLPPSLSVTLSQLLFPSVSPSLFPFILFCVLLLRRTRSHNWTWQCFRDWVAWVNGELPASLKSWVCMCVCLEGGKVMDFAGRSFEGACH